MHTHTGQTMQTPVQLQQNKADGTTTSEHLLRHKPPLSTESERGKERKERKCTIATNSPCSVFLVVVVVVKVLSGHKLTGIDPLSSLFSIKSQIPDKDTGKHSKRQTRTKIHASCMRSSCPEAGIINIIACCCCCHHLQQQQQQQKQQQYIIIEIIIIITTTTTS